VTAEPELSRDVEEHEEEGAVDGDKARLAEVLDASVPASADFTAVLAEGVEPTVGSTDAHGGQIVNYGCGNDVDAYTVAVTIDDGTRERKRRLHRVLDPARGWLEGLGRVLSPQARSAPTLLAGRRRRQAPVRANCTRSSIGKWSSVWAVSTPSRCRRPKDFPIPLPGHA
jgi:hypothetical protein